MNLTTDLSRRHSSGFTLLELMIALVIVGVLSAYAFANYQKSMLKSGRAEAKAALTQIAGAQEQWRFAHNHYAYTVASVYATSQYVPKTPNQFYTITIPSAATNSYSLTATAVSTSRQAKDTDCQTFTLTSTGTQSSTPTSNCW